MLAEEARHNADRHSCLINDCIIVQMSVEGDDFVKKPPRAVEMNTTIIYTEFKSYRLQTPLNWCSKDPLTSNNRNVLWTKF